MKKNNEIEKLYGRFSKEMDSIPLPSEDELMQMLDRHDAQEVRQVPFVPVVRKRTPWRYAVAALLAGALFVFGWLLWPQEGSPSPKVAEQAESGERRAESGAMQDSVIPATIAEPEIIKPRHLASRKAESGKRKAESDGRTADSAVQQETVKPVVLPVEQLPALAETEPADTTAAPQQDAADSTATSPKPEHEIDDYPERPTIKETEDIIKQENSQRALRKRKLSGKRKSHDKDGKSFIEKQKMERDGVRVVTPKSTPPPSAPMPHYIPMGNGQSRIVWY
ncbi:MAG: hypothetical protein IJK99_05510 [Bacteroidales bacterium]|nr:hypothetical protein [Bacteroidales bacterium]